MIFNKAILFFTLLSIPIWTIYFSVSAKDSTYTIIEQVDLTKKIDNLDRDTSVYKDEQFLININTATQEELESLPGIGPVLALRIIEDRESNGYYKKLSNLKRVKGIAEKKLSKIKEFLLPIK